MAVGFIFAIIFGGIASYINGNKNRGNEGLAFAGGFFFGIFGIIYNLCLSKVEVKEEVKESKVVEAEVVKPAKKKTYAQNKASIKKQYKRANDSDMDFARPFPSEAPEFILLGDDEGNMWEFIGDELLRSVNIMAGDPLQRELAQAGEGAPAGRLLKKKIDSGDIKKYKKYSTNKTLR